MRAFVIIVSSILASECGGPERSGGPSPVAVTEHERPSTHAHVQPSGPSAEPVESGPGPDFVAAFAGEPPSGCFGEMIDLVGLRACRCRNDYPPERDGSVRASAYCAPPFYGQDLRSSVAIGLSATPAQAKAGSTVAIELAISNQLDEPIALVFAQPLDKSLGPIHPTVRVHDERGRDVTITGDCGQGASASTGDYLVGLRGRGRARFTMDWPAEQIVSRMPRKGTDCVVTRQSLQPGKYTLAIELRFDRTLRLPDGAARASTTFEVLSE